MLEKIEGIGCCMKLLNKINVTNDGDNSNATCIVNRKVQAASQEFGLQEYRKPVGSTQYGYKVSDNMYGK